MSTLRLRFLAVFAATGIAASARAEVTSSELFEHIPVLENGRVVPMDSFARHILLSFSGKSRFGRESASHWMMRALFDPDSTETNAIFLVNNPEVIEALGLEAKGRSRYSYAQLRPTLAELGKLARAALNLEDEARSPVEKEIFRLHNNLNVYAQLTRSMAFALPQREFAITDPQLRADLHLPPEGEQATYLQLARHADLFGELMEKNRDLPREQWGAYQRELFGVAMAFRTWSQSGSRFPAIIPVPGHEGQLWVGAWDIVGMNVQHEAFQREVDALADMASAFREGQQVAFDLAARTFLSSVTRRMADNRLARKLKLEVRYNKLETFYRAEMLYGFAFLAALCSIMYRKRALYVAGIALTLLALMPHTAGIVMRMSIMGRPPVTNLYATFIFVGWVSAVLGLVVEYFQRNRLGLLTAATAGLVLLLTSGRFASEGDTMGVMVAVLDSNFWLATHVVCISIGYAGCCVAGLLGHIYLLQALRRAPDDPLLKETFSTVYGALGFGLIFSFLGTMLGGVWADQSWGRFWGWDPKENGALVIVLWSAIVFHARLAGMIRDRGFAVGCVLGVIGVLMAWLGVNLLGVGLHSYGFTSELARGFVIACTFEILFVLLVAPFAKRPSSDDARAAA